MALGITLLVLLLCAIATVVSVRLLVIYGIGIICGVLDLPSKVRGQIIGYATSMPEFVVVISSALTGVFDAGFWNIASSNIINMVLFFSAMVVYRQQRDLFNATFIDEICFVVLSVGIPLVFFRYEVALTFSVAAGLLLFFVAYKVVDRLVNVAPPADPDSDDEPVVGVLGTGIGALIMGLVVVIVAGRFLGESAAELIQRLSIPSWLVGWILGFVTSIPEMTSFFEIYRLEKRRGRLHLLHDTQEGLDALVASNMANLGIILPVGTLIYLWVQ